jgi:hypothetical protein
MRWMGGVLAARLQAGNLTALNHATARLGLQVSTTATMPHLEELPTGRKFTWTTNEALLHRKSSHMHC